MPLTLSARNIFRSLTIVVSILIAISLIAHLAELLVLHGRFKRVLELFDVDSEQSIASWYSAIMLAMSAALVALIVYTMRGKAERRFLLHWVVLAAGFLWLSADESVSMHERLNGTLKRNVITADTLPFVWVLPAILAVGVVVMMYIKFLMHLAPRRQRQFIVAGVMFVFGALVMELVGGKIVAAMGKHNLTYTLATHVEEFCEMFAIVLFNCSLLEHLAEMTAGTGLTVVFATGQPTGDAAMPPHGAAAPTLPSAI
jgi:hypothetical protein